MRNAMRCGRVRVPHEVCNIGASNLSGLSVCLNAQARTARSDHCRGLGRLIGRRTCRHTTGALACKKSDALNGLVPSSPRRCRPAFSRNSGNWKTMGHQCRAFSVAIMANSRPEREKSCDCSEDQRSKVRDDVLEYPFLQHIISYVVDTSGLHLSPARRPRISWELLLATVASDSMVTHARGAKCAVRTVWRSNYSCLEHARVTP